MDFGRNALSRPTDHKSQHNRGGESPQVEGGRQQAAARLLKAPITFSFCLSPSPTSPRLISPIKRASGTSSRPGGRGWSAVIAVSVWNTNISCLLSPALFLSDRPSELRNVEQLCFCSSKRQRGRSSLLLSTFLHSYASSLPLRPSWQFRLGRANAAYVALFRRDTCNFTVTNTDMFLKISGFKPYSLITF